MKLGFRKILNDLWQNKGRFLLMAAAVAVSLFGFTVVFSSYSVLTREISRNYLETNPASATFELDRVDQKLLDSLKKYPGLADYDARASLLTRVQVGGDYRYPLLLFVIKDFSDLEIARFYPEKGAWPPPAGTILLERTALELFKSKINNKVVIKAPTGKEFLSDISGTVHDPSLAPAWQERMGYGYISQETYKTFTGNTFLDELKIITQNKKTDQSAVESYSRELAGWLTAQGYKVKEIQVPRPGKHPHEPQMVAILVLLLIFSLLSLILSAVLVANMIATTMAKEVKQIGIMKTIGGTTSKIMLIYLALIFSVSLFGMILAVTPGLLAGEALTRTIADLLNFTLFNTQVPPVVYVLVLMAGIFIPLLISLFPILRGSAITVRQAISETGTKSKRSDNESSNKGETQKFVLKTKFLSFLDRVLLLAFRNTFRKKGRLILSLVLLAAGGAMFMAAINVDKAWEKNLEDSFSDKNYDFELRFYKPEDVENVVPDVSGIPGVTSVEAWGLNSASLWSKDGYELSNVYPDGGHGSFPIRGVPADSGVLSLNLLYGSWFARNNGNGLVLNQRAKTKFPDKKIGDEIRLKINGIVTSWVLAGVVREIGPATAYVANTAFQAALRQEGLVSSVFIMAEAADVSQKKLILENIQSILGKKNINIRIIMPAIEFQNAVTEHIYILIFSLMMMAIIMAVVGILGLASTTSTNIIERRREFGIMRSIGGSSWAVIKTILYESVFISLLSFIGAIILTMPLSLGLGYLLGNLAFMTPLPFVLAGNAVVYWGIIIFAGTIVSSLFPAWQAVEMTIREAIAYE